MLIAQSDVLVERPKVYADLEIRSDFRKSLDPSAHKLSLVLSDYHFAKSVPCGLSQCHTAHQTGFLVRTTTGLETAIGHVCGKKIFGEEVWDIASQKYRRERERLDLLARAREIQSSAPAVQQAVEALMGSQFGVRWVRDVRKTISSLLGEDLFGNLGTAHRRGQLAVTQVRKRSDAEMDHMAEASKRPRESFRSETVVIGHLQSTEWVAFEFTKHLRDELQTPMQDFALIAPDAMATSDLRKSVKVFDGWEKRLSDAEAAAASARGFLASDNLTLLALWIPDRNLVRRRALQEWIDSGAHTLLCDGLGGTH